MKRLILAGMLAALSTSTFAADYYVVVPLPKARPAADNIAVTLNASALPGGVTGAAYPGFDFAAALLVTGDPKFSSSGVSWSVVSGALPAGLVLGADGKLAGTPAAPGKSSFQLQASYKGKSAGRVYDITVETLTANLKHSSTPAGTHAFGVVDVGDSAPLISFSIVNAGNAPGALALPAFTGTNAADFYATHDCTNVAPSANCQVMVGFKPLEVGSRSATLALAGSTFTFTGSGRLPGTRYIVLASGTSYQVPVGVLSVTAWVAGGGGGGAGSINSDSTSGGGGGAGGLTWKQFPVEPGQTLSYAIGAGGAGGYQSAHGKDGGPTTISYGAITLNALGGAGGKYNAGAQSLGGAWAGGSGGANGGAGAGTSGDRGGAGGGALGGTVGGNSTSNGGAGARANFLGGLEAAFSAAGIPTGVPGAAASSGTGTTANINHGGGATGYGHGGGGAGYYGGNGGRGALGGGGGGAAGYTGQQTGGAGGAGFILLQLN